MQIVILIVKFASLYLVPELLNRNSQAGVGQGHARFWAHFWHLGFWGRLDCRIIIIAQPKNTQRRKFHFLNQNNSICHYWFIKHQSLKRLIRLYLKKNITPQITSILVTFFSLIITFPLHSKPMITKKPSTLDQIISKYLYIYQEE
ncbi:Hypothetical_protein [Hexamita inflata]|uniref:Hypothetical_protein n=1 Tax=Hexamita inflata TaxID=28002 RepID=A0AA86NYA4_9EUKA|nr:Hypothetical protein HINF_LOCUS14621 [Hexamita inflata]